MSIDFNICSQLNISCFTVYAPYVHLIRFYKYTVTALAQRHTNCAKKSQKKKKSVFVAL